MTIRGPCLGPRAAAVNSRVDELTVVAVALTLVAGRLKVLALRLWLGCGLRYRFEHQATLSVVLPAGLIDELRSATKNESYQLCRLALRSTRIELSQRSSRSACGM